MDVMPARGFRSQVLLAPGDAAQVELIAPELRNSQDGELAFGGWDATTGYVAVVPSRAGESAYPGPNGPDFDPTPYLRVPAYLRAPLAQVAAEAFSGLPEDAGMPRTVAALMAYFNDNFEYALGVGMDDVTMDPALQFLTRWKRGHCELFATSTVLLLRSRGIPARYVTGFVCSERPPGSRHYVARLQNAHAWAEAYDEESGTWHLVEGTPASGVPSGVSDASLAWSLWDSLKLAWQRMLALMKRGYVAQAIAGFVVGIGSGIVSLFATPARALLTIAVVAVVLGWLASRRHRRRQGLMREVGAGRWLLFRSRDRLLKRFRKVGLQPAPGDTMRHLLARLAGGSPEHAARLAPAIGEYERLRYGPEQPTKEEVKAFDRRLREVLSSCRTRSTRAGDAGSTKGVPAAES
jgi:hypothetical protein